MAWWVAKRSKVGEGDGNAQKLLITLQALSRGTAHNWSNGPPLCWHELGQMQQLLIFFATPFDFADARVQPFGPARFALFGRFAREERGDAGPLVQAVFGDCRFEDFVFDVGPDATFDDGHLDGAL